MDYRRVGTVVLAVFLGYLAVKYLLPLTFPFVIGIFMAGLIDPLIVWIEDKWKWSRSLAVWVTLTISLMVVFLMIAFALGCLYQEAARLVRNMDQFAEISRGTARFWTFLLNRFEGYLPPEWVHSASNAMQELLLYIGRSVIGVFAVLERIPDLIGTTILAVLTAFFVTRDKKFWALFFRRHMPLKWQDGFRKIGQRTVQGVLRLFRLEITMMIIAFFMVGSVLTLFGNPHAWLIGLAVGLLEPLPMIGPGAALLPWSGWLFFTGHGALGLILILICGLLMGGRQWLEVRLLGGDNQIHPLFTIVGLYLGFKLFGLVGLIIAPIALSLASPLARAFSAVNWNSWEEKALSK